MFQYYQKMGSAIALYRGSMVELLCHIFPEIGLDVDKFASHSSMHNLMPTITSCFTSPHLTSHYYYRLPLGVCKKQKTILPGFCSQTRLQRLCPIKLVSPRVRSASCSGKQHHTTPHHTTPHHTTPHHTTPHHTTPHHTTPHHTTPHHTTPLASK